MIKFSLIVICGWFILGLPAAGWFNASLRTKYCSNYLDPNWAHDNKLIFALGGPISTLIELMYADYDYGWTLSRQPVKTCHKVN